MTPPARHYRFIVVGAGSSGWVLAARLSENPANSVLLVEAGKDYPPGTEPPEILDTFAATAYADPRFIWPELEARFGPRPEHGPDLRPRRLYHQGRLIGGTSSINGMAANRGLPSDYDEWAARGAAGWDWDGVLPFFRKLEADRDFGGPMHGSDGPIHIQRFAEESWPGFTRAVIGAAERQGFQRIADQNAEFSDGTFACAYSHNAVRRMGTAWRYLTAEVRRRPNLSIVCEAHVRRILFDGIRATGILLRRGGDLFEASAQEVIVSAGAIQSPALLMRSGIGAARELSALGIAPVAERAGVGRHLMEHPGVNFGYWLRPQARLPRNIRRQMFAALRWSSGYRGCPPGDMYLIPSNKAQWHAIGERLGVTMLWVNRSYSTGRVRLAGPLPEAPPAIDFNMCSDTRDLDRLAIGVRLMCRIASDRGVREQIEGAFPVSYGAWARRLGVRTAANAAQTLAAAWLMEVSQAARRAILERLIADQPSLDELASDDGACLGWIRDAVIGHWHASCTCRMGAPGDEGAVTDPAGRVYGVEGLRVADASIMPLVPCGNTNIPTIMIGEKIASLVLSGR